MQGRGCAVNDVVLEEIEQQVEKNGRKPANRTDEERQDVYLLMFAKGNRVEELSRADLNAIPPACSAGRYALRFQVVHHRTTNATQRRSL